MKLHYTDLIFALSTAIDAVEKQVTGAASEHGKRAAYLCERMVRNLELSKEEKADLIFCAILHDNALGEALREDAAMVGFHSTEPVDDKTAALIVPTHVIYSERNASILPFRTNVRNAILWHHENANGTGPFHLTEAQTSLYSELIHLSDFIDIQFSFPAMDRTEFDEMQKFVADRAGTLFSHRSAELMAAEYHYEDLVRMQEKGVEACLKENVPEITGEYRDDEIRNIALFFAGIVDYKSSFTKDHSMGVANKAYTMAKYYQWDDDKVIRFYLAGALHDVGKLIVPNTILHKPAKLTAEEYDEMKDHAAATYRLLHRIPEFDDITEWAANHHEKLDGTGYSRGLTAAQLTFEDRLMGCLDIYQALTESRPYKQKFSYSQSIDIMHSMAASGKIDAQIVDDIKDAFAADMKEEEHTGEASGTKEFRCDVCGFVYKGDAMPDSCPLCDSPKDIAYQAE
jgi:HD-GYP domain-containing protein (c-di-GMP phosphodiesterase class II)